MSSPRKDAPSPSASQYQLDAQSRPGRVSTRNPEIAEAP